MSEVEHYDGIVIGAGQAGVPLSTALAEAGWKTAIVEREHVGGTCVNEGCTPTKTMVASARVAYLARRAADYGVETGPISVDMQAVRRRKRDIVELFRSGSRRGYIRVDERLETNAPGIYAMGDVKGGPAFTHISYDDFRILRTNLIEDGDASTEERLVPYTVFIDPQLGRVGLSEEQARAEGYNIRVAKMPMSHAARALEVDETRGFMKAVVDADTHQILGCAILGIDGGEVMAALQMAMLGNVPYPKIRDGVFAHPTLAEALNNLFMTIG